MSDDYSEARLRFAYIFPEFARPDFRLPSEESLKKGNEPMDEELFTEETVKRLSRIWKTRSRSTERLRRMCTTQG